jgi:excisionase family DNA binding protein
MEEKIIRQLNRIERNTQLASKNVLTLDDVAVLTGLSKSHLYKLTCYKKIPHYKPNGKQIYFDRKEIEDWMKRNKVVSNDEIKEAADNYLAGIGGER